MTKRKRQRQERHPGRSRLRTIRLWLAANRDIIVAIFLFIAVTLAGFGLVLADWSSGSLLDPMNNWTAVASGQVVSWLGGSVDVSANAIHTDAGSVTIAEGCNTVYVTILMLAAFVAFPTSWKNKLVGILLGSLALFAINLLRVVSLLYLSGYDTELFEIAHLYVWQFLIILFGGILWLIWYDKVVGRQSHAHDH